MSQPLIYIDDNFLNEEEIAHLYEMMVTGNSFERRYIFASDSQVGNEEEVCIVRDDENFDGCPMMVMVGKEHHMENEPFHNYAASLLVKFAMKHKIAVQSILRTKSTITFPKPDPRPDWAHVDYETPGYVLLIYINDSEGETILYDQTYTGEKVTELTERIRVTPKAGRAVLFDNYIYHAVGSPVNNKFRHIINMNFTALPFELQQESK
jgi:hypothetical protein